MKNFRRYILACFLPLCSCFCLYAQQIKIDSLLKLLKKDKEDTNKVIHLNNLSREYINTGSFPDAMNCSYQALSLSPKILTSKNKILKFLAASYNNIGIVHLFQGEYPEALTFYNKALRIDEELKDKKGISKRLGNIGSVYRVQGDYVNALTYFLKALKLSEDMEDKESIAIWIGNIGLVHWNQGNYTKALDYYFRALKMDGEAGNKNGIARHVSNIGFVFYEQGDYKKALDYYFKALKIDEELGDKKGISILLSNIGNVYSDQANKMGETVNLTQKNLLKEKALKYYFAALKISEELGDKARIAIHFGNLGVVYNEKAIDMKDKMGVSDSFFNKALNYYFSALKMAGKLDDKNLTSGLLGNIGSSYTSQKKYKKAYNYLYEALGLSDSIGIKDHTKGWYEALSSLYEKSNIPLPDTIGGKMLNMEQMRLRALYYHKRYIAIRDTLFSEENKKQLVRKEMNFEFEKKEAEAKAEQDKKDAVASADAKRQKIVLLLVSFVLLLVAVVAFIIFRSLRVTRRQKTVIEEQKHLVEEKQKEILDSIYYARRIQRSLLPTEKYIDKSLSKLMRLN